MSDKFVLSEDDRDMLRWVVERVEDLTDYDTPTQRPRVETLDYPTTEIYLAKPPATGIPALSGSGTAGDIPGSAVCNVFQLLAGGLWKAGFDELVYNYSLQPIDGASWVVIARDKFGQWYSVSGSAGSIAIIKVKGMGAQTPNADGTYDCKLEVSPTSGNPLPVTDGIDVWLCDPQMTAGTGEMWGGDMLPAMYSGRTFNGRPLYYGCEWDLIVTDLNSTTDYTRVKRIKFDSTGQSYNSSFGDWVFTLDSSTRELTVRVNGLTGTFTLYYAYCDPTGILYYSATVSTNNGIIKTVVNNDQYPAGGITGS